MRPLTKFERWVLRWILLKIVTRHQMPALFHDLRVTQKKVWFEDNWPTREDELTEALNDYRATPIDKF